MWLWILGVVWTAYALFIVRYLNKLIFKDLKYLSEPMPGFKDEFKPFERNERAKWNLPEIFLCAIFLAPFRLISLVVIISSLAMTSKLLGIRELKQALEELPSWKRFLIRKNLNFVGWGINFACGFMYMKVVQKKI